MSAQQQPQGGTVEHQESSLSARWARQTGPGVVCVQQPRTHGLQTHSASQTVLGGSACTDFLSMTANAKIIEVLQLKGKELSLGTHRTDVDVTPGVLRLFLSLGYLSPRKSPNQSKTPNLQLTLGKTVR